MQAADAASVAALLTIGFAEWRDAAFWTEALRRLGERSPPTGLPRFGYVLEAEGAVVGVLLLIGSEINHQGTIRQRCNVSSWYVAPQYRLYGTLLVHQALRHRQATYLNVSPAPETWPVLAAQGYTQYVQGRALAVPLLARRGAGFRVTVAGASLQPGPDLPAWEVALLQDHARWDCLSLVCEGKDGRVPFVFGLRRRRAGVRFVYLLYCRDLDSVVAHARSLGTFLARRGVMFMVTDADAKLPDMPGRFQGNFPKFFRGTERPRAGDLAYTERAVFGV